MLLPITEPSLIAILPARDRLDVDIPFPELELFLAISDKRLLLEVAAEEGIATPQQWIISRPEAVREIMGRPFPFPLVIKPSRSVGGSAGTTGTLINLPVAHAADSDELLARMATLPEAAYPVLLQQRVIGPGIGVFLLLWDGELLASFAHRRLREKPPAGGVSVYSESVPLDPGLLERSRALLERFDWNGPAMIEYKVDAATQTPYLMEVNGRFWGSLQLAIDAGVDFPALLLAAASGEPSQPVLEHRTGVRLRWLWGDVDHLLIRLRHSPAALSLPPGSPGRWNVIKEFLRFRMAGERNEVFRFEDPGPFIRETVDWFRRR
jgi:predicted ATP-grasp superfamily ATP-dependent carboligase